MGRLKVTMLGAGSFFVAAVARELARNPLFEGSTFMLMDLAEDRLLAAKNAVAEALGEVAKRINIVGSTDMDAALDGANYIITSCEKRRYQYWAQDFQICESHGVYQIKGENGGPGGLIHGLRNICLYKGILEKVQKSCPDAWFMNFSNPMSILCTYFKNYFPKIKALGFCHQVHGSFGVIAEELGMAPGDLEVIAAGVNHMSWLFDIRKRNTGRSCMKEFVEGMSKSKYWREVFHNVPEQILSRELYETFHVYPVGYDEHVTEFMPFMQDKEQWAQYGLHSLREYYEGLADRKSHLLEALKAQQNTPEQPPFPVDDKHPYYSEDPCKVIAALETNTPLYLDAINIRNNGAVDNLPDDVILDVPAVAIGGQLRSIHVGALPPMPCELCRRQTVLHEMIANGGAEGNDEMILQALCLDPFVGSFHKAKAIWADFRKAYAEELVTFNV